MRQNFEQKYEKIGFLIYNFFQMTCVNNMFQHTVVVKCRFTSSDTFIARLLLIWNIYSFTFLVSIPSDTVFFFFFAYFIEMSSFWINCKWNIMTFRKTVFLALALYFRSQFWCTFFNFCFDFQNPFTSILICSHLCCHSIAKASPVVQNYQHDFYK